MFIQITSFTSTKLFSLGMNQLRVITHILVLRHHFMCTHYIVWVTVKTQPCQNGPNRHRTRIA